MSQTSEGEPVLPPTDNEDFHPYLPPQLTPRIPTMPTSPPSRKLLAITETPPCNRYPPRYCTSVPDANNATSTSRMPSSIGSHLLTTASKSDPPKTVDRVLKHHATGAVRAAVIPVRHLAWTREQDMRERDADHIPPAPNAARLAASTTPKPQNSSTRPCSNPAPPIIDTNIHIQSLDQLESRSKNPKSVLRDRLSAGISAAGRKHIIREPITGPNFDELVRNPEKNFATRRL